jgi:hypothetical protein
MSQSSGFFHFSSIQWVFSLLIGKPVFFKFFKYTMSFSTTHWIPITPSRPWTTV